VCVPVPEFGSIVGVSSTYGFSGPVAVRLMGVGLVAVGLLLVLLAVAVAVLSLPAVVLTTGVVLAVLAVLALGLLGTRRAAVVRLDDVGYRIRFVRGAGVRQGEWRQVEDVGATTVAGARCVVLRLRDGRTSTVPVDVLAVDRDDFVRDLQRHLNTGNGYRPLPG
jgi:hypothetical protein